jgi:hypothetical protein
MMGMPPLVFIHVVISLVAIAAGFIVLFAMYANNPLNSWTSFFLWTTLLTSATGYILPAHKLMPSHILGAISIVALAIAFYARFSKKMIGGWLKTFVITAMIAQWLNVFVFVAQIFMKVPAAHALAPTGGEPPFFIAQVTVMVAMIILTIIAVKKFHPVTA